MKDQFAMLDVFPTLSEEELQEVNGGGVFPLLFDIAVLGYKYYSMYQKGYDAGYNNNKR